MTAELARSRGLNVAYSEYYFVSLNEPDGQSVDIDEEYDRILQKRDGHVPVCTWRQDIPGNELADILEAGLVELEGE